MLNRNGQFYEWLLPYLEGGLDEARRAQLEARLGEDPALAAEAKRLRRTVDGLRGAAGRMPTPENARVPADLWPHLRARLVLEPAPRPRARAWWVAGVGAPAAAALIVAAFWLPGWHTPDLSQHSSKPPARQKAAPSSPAHPAMITPAPAGKPKTVVKTTLPKPATLAPLTAPVTVPTHANPFALTPSTPLPPQSVNGVRADQSAPAALPAPLLHPGGSASPRAAPPIPPAPASAPILRKPMPPHPTTATDHDENLPAPAPNKATATAGMSGGAAGPVAAAPKETVNGLGGNARQQAKSSPKAPNSPVATVSEQVGQAPLSARRNKTATRFAAPGAADTPNPTLDADPQASLDSWQAALSAAVRPPLWGENEGDAQIGQALMAAREAGLLDDLRARLEARRTQSPRDLVTGRMLAALYDFNSPGEPALRERRRIAGLEGADGEDWFALARAEERAGNSTAARAAYRHALESPTPPSSFHAAIARGRS